MNKRISLFILIVLALSLFWSSPKPVNALTWWNTDWNYKMKLTIDHTKVGADLTDFPVLVYLNSSRINWSHVRDNLKDIRFIDSTETTELFAELENYTVNDKAWMWVKISSVSHTVDTNFYIYYGNNEILPAMPYWSPNNVWEDSAVMVQHMRDNPDNAHIMDSTQYDNDGTKKGANEPIETASGKIDSAQSFDRIDDCIDVLNPAFNTHIVGSISLWFKSDALYVEDSLLSYFESWNEFFFLFINDDGNIVTRFMIGGVSTSYQVAVGIQVGQWYHLTVVQDGVSLKGYLDGVAQTPQATTKWFADINLNPNSDIKIGEISIFAGHDGFIDETRIYNEAKSAMWIKADYNSGADTLLIYGAEELCPLALTILYNTGIDKLYINGTQRVNNTTVYIDKNTNVNATVTLKPNFIFMKYALGSTEASLIPIYVFNMTNPFTLWSYATPNFFIYEEPTTFTFTHWLILLFIALVISLLAAIKFHIIATVSLILVLYMVINVASYTGIILLAIIVWLLTIMFSIIAFGEI